MQTCISWYTYLNTKLHLCALSCYTGLQVPENVWDTVIYFLDRHDMDTLTSLTYVAETLA